MARGETRRYKAIYFDMRIKDLEKYYSATNPKGAYKKIKAFMISNDFEHEQYSGYNSKEKLTDLEVFDMIYKMSDESPWLQYCMNHFEVTNVGANHDLMELFKDDIEYEDM